MITILESDYIGSGTTRDVYLLPDDKTKCVKIPSFERLTQKRKLRPLYGNFLSLSHWDSTQSDKKRFLDILNRCGFKAFKHLPKFFGEVSTNKGNGLVFEFIGNGKYSETLKAYLKHHPYDQTLERKLNELCGFFVDNDIHFSDWTDENIVLNRLSNGDYNLVVVDGFEFRELVPITRISYFSNKKMHRRFNRFNNKLKKLSQEQQSNNVA